MILVTGASGLVGRHLVRALGDRPSSEPIRLFDVQPSPETLPAGVEFIRGEIEDPDAVAAAVAKVDTVVHLAAKVTPNSRALDELTRVNVDGARNVYAASVQAGCRVFLHMSSAGVYGPPRRPDPFRESDQTMPVTPYQSTKLEAERQLLQIDRKATTLNILRPAGIYGAGSLLEIPAYRRVLHRGWSLEFKGGVIVHPTHVSDVVGAVLAMIDRPAVHGTILNVGGERPLLVQDFEALVAAVLGIRRHRVVLPSALAGPMTAVASFALARMGRPKPLLRAFGRGDVVSSAVDDRLFRQRYPSVPVLEFQRGLQEHIEWARLQSLL